MERLNRYFTLDEFLATQQGTRFGIPNTPGPAQEQNIRTQLAPGMLRVRELLGTPINITSGYRSPAINRAVGGDIHSQHLLGQAADFISPEYGTPLEICQRIASSDIPFDQLIYEGNWVHISFSDSPQHETLTAHFIPGKRVTYTPGIGA